MTYSRAERSSVGKVLAFLVVIGFLFFACYEALQWQNSLRIESIRVKGTRIVNPQTVIAQCGVHVGDALYSIDLFTARRRVMANPFIADAQIHRIVPGTLEIAVVERKPVALLNAGELYAIDRDGVILAPANHLRSPGLLDLPIVSGIGVKNPVTLGKAMSDPNLLELLSILDAVKQVNETLLQRISEFSVSSSGEIILYTVDGAVPILFGHGDVVRKVVALNTFWDRFIRQEGLSQLEYLDLRFNDQVVAKWSRKLLTTHSLEEKKAG